MPTFALDAQDRADLAAAAPLPSDRVERFAQRLDSHLATFATDRDRLVFLQAQRRQWEDRYAEAGRRAARNRGAHDPNGPTATDYLLTISEIGNRISRVREAA